MSEINDKFYTNKELEKGIDGIPSITNTTLRNLRQHKKIKYTKIGRECIYKRSWILDYLKKNEVEINNKIEI